MRQTSRSNTETPRDSSRRRYRLIAVLGLMIFCSGCCLPEMITSTCRPYEELKRRSMLKRRAEQQGRAVWDARYAGRYARNPCAEDVRTGFVVAYAETALGNNGCPPPVPTNPIFSRYTLRHERPAAVPWYEGYHLGHAIAISRGVDRWRLAPFDPDLVGKDCRCRSSAVVPAGYLPLPASNLEPQPEPEPLPPESNFPLDRVPVPGDENPLPGNENIELPRQEQAPVGLPAVQ